jgi:hypothetical protein
VFPLYFAAVGVHRDVHGVARGVHGVHGPVFTVFVNEPHGVFTACPSGALAAFMNTRRRVVFTVFMNASVWAAAGAVGWVPVPGVLPG